MKDSYSFDIDEAGLDKSFDAHRGAYERIFARLGIPAIAAEASNGTMGGKDSMEFMCPSEAGEDLVATCPNCDYAANLERATSALAPVEDEPGPAAPSPAGHARRAHHRGPRRSGTASPADRQIKTLVQVINGELTLVLLRGDHQLQDQKLIDATGMTDIRPAQPDEIRAALGALPGSLGAVGRHRPAGHRRRRAARPAEHGHRREHRRRPPHWRRRRPRHRCRHLGGSARGVGRRAVPPVRRAAAAHPGHRGRPHLQARPQVHHGARRLGARPGRLGRSSRSWAATASASSARWP